MEPIELTEVDRKNLENIAEHLNNLAKPYYEQEKYKEAEFLYLKAVEIYKITLPENHPQLIRHLNNLAKLYYEQGKYEEAEPFFLQAMKINKINKIALSKNDPYIDISLNNLAELYYAQGKYEDAKFLFLKTIEILKKSLGEEHPNTQTVIKNYQIFLNEKNNEENE